MKITKRQQDLLKYIIEEYISTTKPVGSKIVMSKYMPNISSQTIRIEMAKLEEIGFIEKTHTSSGRVPSVEGYKYYDENILVPILNPQIQNKLKSIFNKRVDDINFVIKQTLGIINEITGLPSLSSSEIVSEEKLSEIRLIKLDYPQALIILVSNNANIMKTKINFTNESQMDDLQTCMEIFNKHLVGVKFSEIQQKLNDIEPIIKQQVMEYEFITQEIFYRLFQFVKDQNSQRENQIVGINSILNNPELQDPKKIQQIIKFIEDGNIWKQIKYNEQTNKSSRTKIEYSSNNEFPISIATTSLTIDNKKHHISVLGPNCMDTKTIKGILEYLNNKLEEIFKNEN